MSDERLELLRAALERGREIEQRQRTRQLVVWPDQRTRRWREEEARRG